MFSSITAVIFQRTESRVLEPMCLLLSHPLAFTYPAVIFLPEVARRMWRLLKCVIAMVIWFPWTMVSLRQIRLVPVGGKDGHL